MVKKLKEQTLMKHEHRKALQQQSTSPTNYDGIEDKFENKISRLSRQERQEVKELLVDTV